MANSTPLFQPQASGVGGVPGVPAVYPVVEAFVLE